VLLLFLVEERDSSLDLVKSDPKPSFPLPQLPPLELFLAIPRVLRRQASLLGRVLNPQSKSRNTSSPDFRARLFRHAGLLVLLHSQKGCALLLNSPRRYAHGSALPFSPQIDFVQDLYLGGAQGIELGAKGIASLVFTLPSTSKPAPGLLRPPTTMSVL